MKTRWYLLILGLIAALSLTAILWMARRGHGPTVLVSQDGQLLYTLDLSQVSSSYTVTIPWEGGYNVLTITPETVYISEADCENQVCVQHGSLQPGGTPITCLPHRLIVRWADAS